MRNYVAFAMFCFSLLVSNVSYGAGNSVYMDQIGDNSTLTVTQTGSGNALGTNSASAKFGGDSQTVLITQIGMNNTHDVTIDGSRTTFNSNVTGNNNQTAINCGTPGSGSCNDATLKANASGDGNTMRIRSTGMSDSEIIITGDTNTAVINNSSSSLLGSKALIDISGGNDNSVGIVQDGTAGVNGHDASVTVVGASNTVNVAQGGTVDSTVRVTTTGSSNTINIKSNHQ
jgi:hypothetical protein